MLSYNKIKKDPSESILLTNNAGNNNFIIKNDLVKTIFDSLPDSSGDLPKFASSLLIRIAREKEILQGMFLLYDGKTTLNYLSCYAYNGENTENLSFELGEGLPGQVAQDRKLINLSNVPKDYIIVRTGLGHSSPNSLIVFPVNHKDLLIGVIELASFHPFTADDESFFLEISERIGEKIFEFSKMEVVRNG
jgi:putative methionine-R-sulfoxide reductase with GAF domain